MISAAGSSACTAALAASVVFASIANTAGADPGDLDPSFGVHGRVSSDIRLASLYPPELSAIAQSDSKIVAAGTLPGPDQLSPTRLFVARFATDGTADLTFGNGGVIGNTQLEQGRAIIQQSDGQLVAVGGIQNDVALIRLNELGVADAGFGSGGTVQLDLGDEDLGLKLLEQADGRLIVAAQSIRRNDDDRDSDIVLLRLEQDGALDTTFGDSGMIRIEFPDAEPQESNWESASGLAEDSSGRIVISGYRFHEHVPNFVAANLVLMRLSADGVLDPTFGDDGIVEFAYGADTTSVKPYAVQTLPDDGILVAGGIGAETGWGILVPGDGFIARFAPNGTLDRSFGAGGIVVEDIGAHGDFDAVAMLADGRILAAGSTEIPIGDDDWQTDISLTRFLPSGRIDESFGEAGTTLADFGGLGSGPQSQSASLLVEADGSAIVVGSHASGAWTLGMARFDGAGPGFGGLIGLTEIEHAIAADDMRIEFVVRRTGGSTGAVSVEYRTVDRLATAGVDYAAAAGTLSWDDGDTTEKTIAVDLLTASFGNGPQFELELFAPQGGAELAANRATVEFPTNEPDDGHGLVPLSTGSDVAPDASATKSPSGGGSTDPIMLLCLVALAILRFGRIRCGPRETAPARR